MKIKYVFVALSVLLSLQTNAKNELRFNSGVSGLDFISASQGNEELTERVTSSVNVSYYGSFETANKTIESAVSMYDGNMIQKKISAIDLIYTYETPTELIGFQWMFDKRYPHHSKWPRTVQIQYMNIDGDWIDFDTLDDTIRYNELQTINFIEQIPKSSKYKFIFTNSYNGDGYIAIEYFKPF